MVSFAVRYLAYALAMTLIYGIVNGLYNREDRMDKGGQTDTHYFVKMPAQLGFVYGAMFAVGMILFVVVFICRLRGVQSATVGLMRFALIFALIGLAVMIWAKCWRVTVNGAEIRIHRLFHRCHVLYFHEISRVCVTKRFRIDVYQNDKRIIKVNLMCDNYERFQKNLEERGKLDDYGAAY